jgi:hypothetical protein
VSISAREITTRFPLWSCTKLQPWYCKQHVSVSTECHLFIVFYFFYWHYHWRNSTEDEFSQIKNETVMTWIFYFWVWLLYIHLVTKRCKHLRPWMFEIIRFMCTSQLKQVLTVRFIFSDFISYHNKSSHTWYKHRFVCERATVSTSCIWQRADTVTRRDENEGRNLSSRGFNMTCMGVTARITRRSYTMRKRSTDKLPCLNKPNMYKLITHYHFSTRHNCNSHTFILTKRSR